MGVLELGVRADGKPFTLPEEFVRSRYAIVAASGYGKTVGWTKAAEQLVKLHQLFIALDVVGNGWGLRVGIDKNPGLPVLVVGGRKADMPLLPDQGKRYAHAFTARPIPVVVDMSTTALDDRWRFTADFCSELLMIQPDADRHVFFEELKELASQQPRNKWHKKATDAVDSFCTLGRNYGYGYTVVGQRTAIMAKGPLTQAQALFAMHLQGTLDIDSIVEWISNNGPDLEAFGGMKALKKTLTQLAKGEALYVDPSAPEPLVRMRFGQRETIHPAEVQRTNPKALKSVHMTDVRNFVGELSASIERDLKRTVVAVPTPETPRRKPTVTEETFDRMAEGNEKMAARIQELEREVLELRDKLEAERSAAQSAERRLQDVREHLQPQYDALRRFFEQVGSAPSHGSGVDRSKYAKMLEKAPKAGIREMAEYLFSHGRATRQQLATFAAVCRDTSYKYIRWMVRVGIAEEDPNGREIVLRKM